MKVITELEKDMLTGATRRAGWDYRYDPYTGLDLFKTKGGHTIHVYTTFPDNEEKPLEWLLCQMNDYLEGEKYTSLEVYIQCYTCINDDINEWMTDLYNGLNAEIYRQASRLQRA